MLKHINTYFNSQPGYLIFYVTNRCNFNCSFCYYAEEIQKGLKHDELQLDEITKLSKNFDNLIQISFAGGEPFLRKDFNELTNIFIKNSNVKYVNIPTNASLTAKMIRYLEEVLPKNPNTSFRLTFSIDGIKDDHDTNRSMPGSFAKIEKSFELISPMRKKYKNLSLDSNTVFTTNTEKKMIDILKYLEDNFTFDNHTITYARGEIPDPSLKSKSKKHYEDALEFIKSIDKRKENRSLYFLYRGVREIAFDNIKNIVFEDQFITPCVAGKKLIVISEEGNVYPCEILTLSHPLGNVREYDYDIKKIMNLNNTKKTQKWIKDTKCKCSFECAMSANVAWNFSQYPKILKSSLKNISFSEKDI